MKNKKRIYDRHELLDLVNKEHSCIILKHCNRKIELQAKYLKDVKSGIKEALDSGLNKFDYSLNGILLDYQNLNVLVDEWSGRIVGRFGEFLVTVTADFFVFDPKIGSLLEGVVNVKSSTHVGCLVHKRFNAMILKPDVEDKWNCENIQIGDKIIFTIVDHVFSTNIPHIEGVLATEYIGKSSKNSKKKSKISESKTQDFTENGKFDDLDVTIEANKKIRKHDEVDSSIINVGKQEENDLASIMGKKSQKSKSKKRKIDPMGVIDNMDVEESVLQVKKKKRSKSKVKNETTLETEKPLEPISESSIPVENPVSVFSAKVLPTAESEYVPKSRANKKDKKDSGNKSVTWETENVLSHGAESKTTLLQRFEKCLDVGGLKLMNDFANKSKNTPVKKEVNETEGSPAKKKSNGESPAAKGRSNKKAASDKERNKSEDDLGQSVTQRMSYSKIFSVEGVDDTQLNNPVKTSTPKTALNSSDIPGGKVKKQRPKKAKKASGDDERASIINALLEQAKESLGISELFKDPSKNTKK